MDETQELVAIIRNEVRVDSRVIAKGLGIQHETFLKTLRKYQDQLETLGILRFEIGEIDGRGQPPTYAMLNKDQVTFAMQLSRNTEQVVNFKLALTVAISKAEKQIEKYKQLIAIHEAEKAKMIPNAKVDELELLLIHFRQLAQQKRLPGPELLEEAIMFMRQHHYTITAFDQKLIDLYNTN